MTATALLAATLILPSPATSSDQPTYGRVISDSWRLNIGYGTLKVLAGDSNGRTTSVSITNGATVIDDHGSRWDFEAGLSYALSDPHPHTPGGGSITIGQAELFSQARRLLGTSGWFIGWHLGIAHLTMLPEENESTRELDASLGLISGWISPWGISFQLEAITTSTSPDLSIPEHLRVEYKTLQYRGTIGVRF